MSGHSKWSSIKHKKAAADAKRGKLSPSSRGRSPSPPARAAATPTATRRSRRRSRRRATPRCPRTTSSARSTAAPASGAEPPRSSAIIFEGYGPGGVAILVEALTDNRNRTSAEVRHAFTKHGGSLGEPGSVAWIFEKRGVILVDGARYGEDDLIAAIDAGAEDVSEDGDLLKVISDPADLSAVREALEAAGVEIESAELTMEPKSMVEVGEGEARIAAAPASTRSTSTTTSTRSTPTSTSPRRSSRKRGLSRPRRKASGARAQNHPHEGRDGHRPRRGEPRLRRRPDRGQPHGRPRRRRDRDARPSRRWSGAWSASTARSAS